MIILVITGWFFRVLRTRRTAELVRISVVLTGLTVAFEFIVGRFVDRKSWSELIGNYALWNGKLWPLLLLLLALTPFIWGRWTRHS